MVESLGRVQCFPCPNSLTSVLLSTYWVHHVYLTSIHVTLPLETTFQALQPLGAGTPSLHHMLYESVHAE